jgi:predicted hotdog family 3-hydroxylacyl-ACP dehydratase
VTTYPPIAELIPHTGAMVLLDTLNAWEKGSASCSATIREHAPFVVDGAMQSAVTIELMAQAVAACLGYEALTGGEGVRVGMIIACKRFEAYDDTLRVNDVVAIDVRCMQGNEALSHFDCKVTRGGALFSEAVLTLYHAPTAPR